HRFCGTPASSRCPHFGHSRKVTNDTLPSGVGREPRCRRPGQTTASILWLWPKPVGRVRWSWPGAVQELKTDVLIIGSGGAGLLAALHASERDPALDIVLASKGLVGKSGCTRMVQGGYNAVLDPADSLELHFADTLKG